MPYPFHIWGSDPNVATLRQQVENPLKKELGLMDVLDHMSCGDYIK
jgi:hypothetical protein